LNERTQPADWLAKDCIQFKIQSRQGWPINGKLELHRSLNPLVGIQAEMSVPTATLDDDAYLKIRAMIADGTLKPGDRIVPEQLARDMGISRTPLLGALKRLFQERIVEWRSRRGVFVRRLSPRELAQIFEVREVLEGLAARRAAENVSRSEVDSLADLFKDIQADETPAMRRIYLQRDYQFHARVLELAANPTLTAGLESLNILVSAFAAGLIRSIREGIEEHTEIFAALRARDANAAEAAMRKHIRRSVERLYLEAAAEEDDPGTLANRGNPSKLLKSAAARRKRGTAG
jgi:GntR family transcriptional regulator, vanillate catabolism transcriptional regulator